jgi:hypothetical protein
VEPADAVLAASALHAGFQAVVTVVVYPALVAVPSGAWAEAHAAHSRRITAVVAPVYVLVAAACLWLLASGPYPAPLLVAVAGNAVAALVTALVAAPAHSRLGRQVPTPRLVRHLLLADRVRLMAATIALAGALVA